MPTEHEISCINKSQRTDPHEHIINIGGRNQNGSSWTLSQAEAIAGIETGKWAFYVLQNNRKAKVVIATSSNGNKYLKTEADSTTTNNLLALPECR